MRFYRIKPIPLSFFANTPFKNQLMIAFVPWLTAASSYTQLKEVGLKKINLSLVGFIGEFKPLKYHIGVTNIEVVRTYSNNKARLVQLTIYFVYIIEIKNNWENHMNKLNIFGLALAKLFRLLEVENIVFHTITVSYQF